MALARRLALLAACATLSLAGASLPGPAASLPSSSLAVRQGGDWKTFWRSSSPLVTRSAIVALGSAIDWKASSSGSSWAELELAGSGEAWRTRIILVRIDPTQSHLELANGASPGGYDATWTIESAPPEAIVAVNAGQFSGGAAWGWVVHDGVEYREPGTGPLAAAVVIDSAGAVAFLDDSEVARRRETGAPEHPAGVREGFQSYPVLLSKGAIPQPLLVPSPVIDLGHRDARLALGQLPDGTLLIALTRFDALGNALGAVPFGLTITEMAALMKALGCQTAVALDGGVSAQLMIRDLAGVRRRWRGMREVPLALLVLPRAGRGR